MKTYAETQGKAPFDWNAFLAKESYTEEEIKDARQRVVEWDANFSPHDVKLNALMIEFYYLIKMMQREATSNSLNYFRQKAISTLHAIEYRSQEIINDLKNKK